MSKNENLKFNIITPSKIEYSDYVKTVYFADDQGDIVILNNYQSTIGKVKRSLIKITDFQNNKLEFIVDNGVYSIVDSELNFFTSFCIKNTEEDKQHISELRQKTLNVLNEKNLNKLEFHCEVVLFKQIATIRRKEN